MLPNPPKLTLNPEGSVLPPGVYALPPEGEVRPGLPHAGEEGGWGRGEEGMGE